MSDAIEMTVVNEKRRTYVYPDGFRLTYENVAAFGRGSSTHRLKLADGTHVIVMPGFVAVELDITDWTL